MVFRLFPKPARLTRRQPQPDAPRRWSFTRIWIACLPLSIAAISGAILISGGDPEQRPFLIFGVGIAAGVLGLASLFVGLIEAGNIERARRRARDAAKQKSGPSA